jgi:hypothetical protein
MQQLMSVTNHWWLLLGAIGAVSAMIGSVGIFFKDRHRDVERLRSRRDRKR